MRPYYLVLKNDQIPSFILLTLYLLKFFNLAVSSTWQGLFNLFFINDLIDAQTKIFYIDLISFLRISNNSSTHQWETFLFPFLMYHIAHKIKTVNKTILMSWFLRYVLIRKIITLFIEVIFTFILFQGRLKAGCTFLELIFIIFTSFFWPG
jgi:hypothetical protein